MIHPACPPLAGGAAADGSKGDEHPDHQRLGRERQQAGHHGFKPAHNVVLLCRIIPARLTYELLRFVAILLRAVTVAENAIV